MRKGVMEVWDELVGKISDSLQRKRLVNNMKFKSKVVSVYFHRLCESYLHARSICLRTLWDGL